MIDDRADLPHSIYIPMPTVIEKSSKGERAYDIYSRLLEDRIIFIGTDIIDALANSVVAQLLFLQKQHRDKDVQIYINTAGGSIDAGLAIYDTMQFLACDIATYCIGQASSMGAVLLAGGTKGKRFALPHSSIMIHQPMWGARGTASDIKIAADELRRKKRKLNEIIAFHSGRTVEEVEKAGDRDHYMSAHDAKEFGLVDEVIDPHAKT